MWYWMLEQCLHVQHGIDLGRSCETIHERRCEHEQPREVLLVANGRIIEDPVEDGEQTDVVQNGFHGRLLGG